MMSQLAKTFLFVFTCAALIVAHAPAAIAQNVNDGFDPNADGPVYVFALQDDGRILVGGAFENIGGASLSCLARLNADGSVDANFNAQLTSAAGCDVRAIVVQANGQILIAGFFDHAGTTPLENIARLAADGSVDTTFASTANEEVNALAVQSDGRILLGGAFGQVNGQPSSSVARLNADGSTDTAFAIPAPAQFNDVGSILVQPDGRIVISGNLYPHPPMLSVGVLRLLPNGAIDSGFDPGVSNAGQDAYVYAMALQADGKLVLGGLFVGVNNGAYETLNLARVNADGSADPGFDNLANPVIDQAVTAIALQANGDIVIGGGFSQVRGTTRNGIARVSGVNGAVSSFNPDVAGAVSALAVQSDNKILIGGSFSSVAATARDNIARVSVGGDLDDTLDLAPNGSVAAIAAAQDGSLLIGGDFTQVGATTRNYIARILPEGKLGAGYNPNANDDVFAIAIEADGTALVGGRFTQIDNHNQAYLAHLSSGGSVDTSFVPVFDGAVSGILVETNGQILIYGVFTHINGMARSGFARLNVDGSLDVDFIANPNDYVFQLAEQSNGQILLVGAFTQIGSQSVGELARLNSDGSVDTSLAVTNDGNLNAIAAESDGNLLVTGYFTMIDGQACVDLARLNADGTFNRCFSMATDGSISTLVELSNQKILITGIFQHFDGNPYAGVVRLNANGSLDNTFEDLGLDGEVDAFAVAPDGKVVLGGTFTMAEGHARPNLLRISVPEAAQQSLTVNAKQTSVTWSRDGSGEILASPPTLSYSSDGSTYSSLGAMTHISGGWRYTGLQPAMAQNYYLRVQAPLYAPFGSQSTVQDTAEFYLSDDIFNNGFEN
jgi:uncharacterized delta-60 repeat protein